MTETIKIKRQIRVKTIITEDFKERATKDLSEEVRLLNSQIEQLQLQQKQLHEQLEKGTIEKFGLGRDQVNKIMSDIDMKHQQLHTLRNNLYAQSTNIAQMPIGSFVVTGMLENYVDLVIGDNIYEKMKSAEIIVKDGLVVEIKNI